MSIPSSREQLKDWCLNNKYTRWYMDIIDNAILREQDDLILCYYVEKHHIIPKSIIKNNDIVKLTAREHFICHLLLPKMLKNANHVNKMKLALNRLIHGNKKEVYVKNSKTYEIVKKWHSEAASHRSKEVWSRLTETQRSEMRSGEKNGRYGKEVSEITRRKISESNKGKLSNEKHPLFNKGHTEETKKKMSLEFTLSGRNKGKNNPMYGKIGAAKNKKWYHNPIEKTEKYFLVGQQPENFIEGRLRHV